MPNSGPPVRVRVESGSQYGSDLVWVIDLLWVGVWVQIWAEVEVKIGIPMRFRVAESESQLYRDTDLGPMHGAFSAIAERLVSVTSLAEQTQTDRNFIQTTGRPDVMLLGGIFLSLLEKNTPRPYGRYISHRLRYYTIRDAILTFDRKPTWASLIYRTETTTKKCKTEKVKTDMLRSNSKILGNHVVSRENENKNNE